MQTTDANDRFPDHLLGGVLDSAESAAREAGAVLLSWRGRVQPREKSPADLVTEADVAAQRTIERRLTAQFPNFYFIGEEGPATARLPTDASPPSARSDCGWIVDPLDGTTNFVHGMDDFCVSVALRYRNEIVAGVIYDPVRDQLFSAGRGRGAYLNGDRLQVSRVAALSDALVAASFAARVPPGSPEVHRFVQVLAHAQAIRRLGSAALNLAYLAAGRLDAYWASSVQLWDVAAGLLCVEEAGGRISSLDGSPLDLDRPWFAAAATGPLHEELLEALRV
jgi:myo-inositol-1(or 4)-monophosphatase